MTDEVRESLDRANAGCADGAPGVSRRRVLVPDGSKSTCAGDAVRRGAALGAARLRANGADGLGESTRLIGSFRAHGLLVPVWDLAPGTEAEAVEQPALEWAGRLADALTETAPLTADERRVRAGLTNRQVTLR